MATPIDILPLSSHQAQSISLILASFHTKFVAVSTFSCRHAKAYKYRRPHVNGPPCYSVHLFNI